MTVGAEPKKVAILAALLAAAAYLMYTNVFATTDEETASAATAPVGLPNAASGGLLNANAQQVDAATAPSTGDASTSATMRARRAGDAGGELTEFRPSLKRREGEKIDPARIDPTLELYRLERLKAAAAVSGGRNLFEFAAAAPPPVPDVKIQPKPVVKAGPAYVPPPPPAPPQQPQTAQMAKPAPPPIPLKYYGFAQREFEVRTRSGGARRGLFLRGGEEIFPANEGDIIAGLYKVVKIEANQAQLEDVRFPGQPQAIRLEQPPEQ